MRKRTAIIILMIVASMLISCKSNDINKKLADLDNKEFIEVDLVDKQLLNRSEELSDLVVELYGIDDATTIVFNNDAYVAIVLAFDQEMTDDLKSAIVYQIIEKDKEIENVYISNSSKIFKQIDDVIFNLLQGQSFDSQVKDINKIADKIKKEK